MLDERYQLDSPAHTVWLSAESDRLVAFASAAVNPSGGFSWLDSNGLPDAARPLPLYAVARMVHCFSVEHLLGRPDAARIAAHGVSELAGPLADREYDGFFASRPPTTETADSGGASRKEAYGHAFALLAGASGTRAAIGGADDVMNRARAALDHRFWEPRFGASRESFDRDFARCEDYRGQNSNMHLAEAYLAAYDLTRDEEFVDRAQLIAERVVRDAGGSHEWRVPEHFTADWTVDPEYNCDRPDDPFRPYGSLVGHSLEWARLLLQLRTARPTAQWTLAAAEALFARAIADGWDTRIGGFLYSVDDHGRAVNRSRMHWAAAEAVGAALWLYRATGDPQYRDWYAEFWKWIDDHLVDRVGGSWWHELDERGRPSSTTWDGKPDLYHAWQATLYARVEGTLGIGEAASRGRIAVAQPDRQNPTKPPITIKGLPPHAP